jgi:hypothetical protein
VVCGYEDRQVEGWHIWVSEKCGGSLYWKESEEFRYKCGWRNDAEMMRCRQYRSQTGALVGRAYIHLPSFD